MSPHHPSRQPGGSFNTCSCRVGGQSLLAATLLLALSTGCASVLHGPQQFGLKPMQSANSGTTESTATGAEMLAGSVSASGRPAEITVEVHPLSGKPQRGKLPLRSGMLVQDVLEQTGLRKKFANMDLNLKRRTGDANRVIPMPIRFDGEQRRVAPETDYTLHAGDYLIVRQVSNSQLERMLERNAGPLLQRYSSH